VAQLNGDGRGGVGAENMRPYLLDRIARAFPSLKIIGAHLGLPHANEALQMISSYDNLYSDFSGGNGDKVHIRKVLAALLPPAGLKQTCPIPWRTVPWNGSASSA
jgi:predicted TIM-barrel fold metal-dependent hydrolase